jgi:hypothetical protein
MKNAVVGYLPVDKVSSLRTMTVARTTKQPRTAERILDIAGILDIAERLVQLRDFNNFSYADVASELGTTKASQQWLVRVLAQGQQDTTLSFAGSTTDVAQSILGTLAGAMLVARPYGDLARFNSTAQHPLARSSIQAAVARSIPPRISSRPTRSTLAYGIRHAPSCVNSDAKRS